jgi:Skp family chaperone for outer membrane proteins
MPNEGGATEVRVPLWAVKLGEVILPAAIALILMYAKLNSLEDAVTKGMADCDDHHRRIEMIDKQVAAIQVTSASTQRELEKMLNRIEEEVKGMRVEIKDLQQKIINTR